MQDGPKRAPSDRNGNNPAITRWFPGAVRREACFETEAISVLDDRLPARVVDLATMVVYHAV
jgi:hypothetical protein